MTYHLPAVPSAPPQALTPVLAAALSQRETLSLASAIAHTIFSGHEHGIVYGTLSPSAILVADDRSITIDRAAEVPPDRAPRDLPQSRAGARPGGRPPLRHLGVRLHPVRDAEQDAGIRRRFAGGARAPRWSSAIPTGRACRATFRRASCTCSVIACRRIRKTGCTTSPTRASSSMPRCGPTRISSSGWHRSNSRLGPRLGWVAAALLPIIAAWLFGDRLRPAAVNGTGAVPALHAVVPVQAGTTLTIGRGASIALSADGSRLVYVAESQGQTQLFLRPLDRFDAQPIPGSAGAADPFFSPDGQWIGFFAGEKLMKVPVTGGAAVTIADTPDATRPDLDRRRHDLRHAARQHRVVARAGHGRRARSGDHARRRRREPSLAAGPARRRGGDVYDLERRLGAGAHRRAAARRRQGRSEPAAPHHRHRRRLRPLRAGRRGGPGARDLHQRRGDAVGAVRSATARSHRAAAIARRRIDHQLLRRRAVRGRAERVDRVRGLGWRAAGARARLGDARRKDHARGEAAGAGPLVRPRAGWAAGRALQDRRRGARRVGRRSEARARRPASRAATSRPRPARSIG